LGKNPHLGLGRFLPKTRRATNTKGPTLEATTIRDKNMNRCTKVFGTALLAGSLLMFASGASAQEVGEPAIQPCGFIAGTIPNHCGCRPGIQGSDHYAQVFCPDGEKATFEVACPKNASIQVVVDGRNSGAVDAGFYLCWQLSENQKPITPSCTTKGGGQLCCNPMNAQGQCDYAPGPFDDTIPGQCMADATAAPANQSKRAVSYCTWK
jgi:hypothetical protein